MSSYYGRSADNISNVIKLDNITFNGGTTYALTQNGVAFVPNNSSSILISIDGVVQQGNFTVNSSNIVFNFSPTSSNTCNWILHIGVGVAYVPAASSITKDKTDFISTSSSAGLQIKGDGTTDGTLQLNCSQNSHGIKLKSPQHSTSSSYTLTFPGTDPAAGKMIQTDGSGNLSFVDAPSGGGLVRINGSAISSTVSSVSFQGAFTSTYKTYLITISGVVMSSAADTRFKFMSGSSIISDTYKMVFHGYRNAGDSNEGQQSSTSGLILHHSASKTDQPVNGFIYVFNPLNTSYHKHLTFLVSYKDSNDYYVTQNGSGIWENTGAADGFQILRGNGSLYSAGEIQVYGLTNA